MKVKTIWTWLGKVFGPTSCNDLRFLAGESAFAMAGGLQVAPRCRLSVDWWATALVQAGNEHPGSGDDWPALYAQSLLRQIGRNDAAPRLSVTGLADLLKQAKASHTQFELDTGGPDPYWEKWYARFIYNALERG